MNNFEDIKYMKLALSEAAKGEGAVNPNPLVGAVVVRDGEILSTGYHEKYGEYHAERNALLKIEKKAQGATIYVTLEPCSHYGKTPPCVDIIIESGIKRCVIATLDSNPKVSGRGVQILKDAGIVVELGVLEEGAKALNKVFFKYIESKKPYIFLKCGITLDGRIATKNFSSKWITNSISREKVQRYRNKFMGILVGKNTVIQDNPSLNTRIHNGRDPFRITIDSKLEIPLDYKIFENNHDRKTIIITSHNMVGTVKYNLLKEKYGVIFIALQGEKFLLSDVFNEIGKIGIDSIMVEGGNAIISQLFDEKLIDGGEFFIAPKILGDDEAIPFISGFNRKSISEAIELSDVKYHTYGDNIGLEFSMEKGE